MKPHYSGAIASQLAEALAKSGLTIDELADRSGIRIGRLKQYLSGKQVAQVRTFTKVADALGCHIQWYNDSINVQAALPDLIARLRESQGLSQDEVADATGLSRQTAWALESGKQLPNYSTLSILLNHYGTELTPIIVSAPELDRRSSPPVPVPAS